ncbi:hypothetical protein P171DRAFT_471007 [Karstenula rhodostoma CBS 690.94]|uniref:Uncharacterized protein n=1 Tax=Karstenula rhodostoma CBS 690.94 TaxID=1392251 RepID=A0A9P4PPK0_9PLEO|nr:hypothetical protein P171DRAFT_471007 [Karstenula rhodostoma CBS 690.94]
MSMISSDQRRLRPRCGFKCYSPSRTYKHPIAHYDQIIDDKEEFSKLESRRVNFKQQLGNNAWTQSTQLRVVIALVKEFILIRKQSVVILSNYLCTLDALGVGLRTASIVAARFDGTIGTEQRQMAVFKILWGVAEEGPRSAAMVQRKVPRRTGQGKTRGRTSKEQPRRRGWWGASSYAFTAHIPCQLGPHDSPRQNHLGGKTTGRGSRTNVSNRGDESKGGSVGENGVEEETTPNDGLEMEEEQVWKEIVEDESTCSSVE